MVADERSRDQIPCLAPPGRSFWHRHREICLTEYVDVSLPSALTAAVNQFHE
jgi:hypothetical protein